MQLTGSMPTHSIEMVSVYLALLVALRALVPPTLTAELRLREPPQQIDRQERKLYIEERNIILNQALTPQDINKVTIITEERLEEEEKKKPTDTRVVIDIIDKERVFENVVPNQEPLDPDDHDEQNERQAEVHLHFRTPENRGLVPQLWKNYTAPILPPPENVSCSLSRLKCSYRAGCGLALRSYAFGCSELAAGRTKVCSTHCRHSLIALLSTLEGTRLMKCNCEGDEFCEMSKANIETCKDEVMHATKEDAVVSCPVAQWICAADPLCSTALEYYNLNCRAMFRGKRCSKRCLNSISILRRQSVARKLETCFCDGTEEYDCSGIKANMENLCFPLQSENNDDLLSNEIEAKSSASGSNSTIVSRLRQFLLALSVFFGLFATYLSALLLGSPHSTNSEAFEKETRSIT